MNYLFSYHQWYGGISLLHIINGTVVYLSFISSVVRRYIYFIVSGTSMNYISLYHQWYGGIYLFMPSVERWYVLSSVVRRYISFIVSGTSMNYISLYHQWYGGIYLFHAFSGTLVCVIVSGTAVHLFYRQWYVYELHLLISSVVRLFISLSCLQWNVGMCYRQWYVDESFPSISSVVRWYISLHAFIGTLVCVIV